MAKAAPLYLHPRLAVARLRCLQGMHRIPEILTRGSFSQLHVARDLVLNLMDGFG